MERMILILECWFLSWVKALRHPWVPSTGIWESAHSSLNCSQISQQWLAIYMSEESREIKKETDINSAVLFNPRQREIHKVNYRCSKIAAEFILILIFFFSFSFFFSFFGLF